LKAQSGYQPSYAWRSLFNAKPVIELGLRWSIGNGQQVKIWKDSWLPELSSFKVWSPVRNLDEDAVVAELIDVDLKKWKSELVLNSFNDFEARQILNIPLSWLLPEDKMIWSWERNGQYSVRSAYHLLKEETLRANPEPSTAGNTEIWKAIWTVQAPQRVKHFLWRVAKRILPTRCRLEQKGVVLDPSCPFCHNEKESQEHIFMNCQEIRRFWFISPLGLHVPTNVNLFQWMVQWLSNSNFMATQLFSLSLWTIWKMRNDAVFNKKVPNIMLVVQNISTLAED
jgi:hypothetical protein